MPLSRMAITMLMVAGASPAPAFAQLAGADRAMNRYRQVFKPTAEIDCPRPDDNSDAITVCGRRGETDPNRLPLPVRQGAGSPTRLLPGEAPRATMNVGGCIRLCPQPVQVDLIKAVPAIVEGIKKILDPDR